VYLRRGDPHEPLVFGERRKKRPSIYTPGKARSPITAGWTGEAGGRQRVKNPGGNIC